MRIKTLRIKNLNSLKGEFTIDFSPESALGRSGLFAITGTIGAGKTTILDAICVALFGQTPRLDPRAIHQIMSRHTGDCYAEVDFSINKKVYRSKWTQRRAHLKVNGKLRPVVMELSELNGEEGTILEEKKTEVIKRVEALTGLDFERFTRSMMLAQGNFAAFLNAKDNDRAELLEKMTGTAIYSDISQAVFERAKEEKQALTELELQLEGVQLMPEEEVTACQSETRDLGKKVKENQAAFNSVKSDITWLNGIQELELSQQKYKKELEKLTELKQNRQSELNLFQRAQKALPLKGDFELLKNQRQQVDILQKNKSRLQAELPTLSEQYKNNGVQISIEKKGTHDFKHHFDLEEEKILETLKKDESLKALEQQISRTLEADQKLQANLDLNLKKQETYQNQNRALESSISVFLDYLEENKHHQALPGELRLMESMIQTFHQNQSALQELDRSFSHFKQERDRVHQSGVELNRITEEKGTKLKAAQAKVSQLTLEMQQLTRDTSLADLEKKKQAKTHLKEGISRLMELGKEVQSLQAEQKKAVQNLNGKAGALKAAEENQKEGFRSLKEATDLCGQLEEKLNMEQMIKKYEDDRSQLQPETPCPLCGSKTHPWVEGYVVEPNKTQGILQQQKEAVQQLQAQVQKTEREMAILQTEMDQTVKHQEETKERLNSIVQKWNTVIQPLDIDLTFEKTYQLPDLLQTFSGELQNIEERLTRGYQLQKTIEGLHREIQTLTQEHSADQLQQEQNRSRYAQFTEQLAGLKQQKDKITLEIHNSREQIRSQLAPYKGCTEQFEKGDYSGILISLKERSTAYLKKEKELENSKDQLSGVKENMRGIEAATQQITQQKGETTAHLKTSQERHTQLKKERELLLGDKDPLRYKNSLLEKKEKLENGLKDLETRQAELGNQITLKEKFLQECVQNLAEGETQLATLTASFTAALKTAGIFEDESDYRSSLLTDERYQQLEELQNDIFQKETALNSNLSENKKLLQVKKEEQLTQETVENLKIKESQIGEILSTQQQKLGALSEKLEQHQKQVKVQAEKVKKIEQHRKAYNQWNQLNVLIGSADGVKFRRFAQGLTLDHLITLANQNLTKLNRRYILQRDRNAELGLEVVDTYQANITRSTSTLSGGESFLTSLSLALGLSNLASQHTQIDSLFLDEGFGTLDTETLEMALDALNSLNASGKTIGIISHVEALKERIPTQLKVIKQAGGNSVIHVSE